MLDSSSPWPVFRHDRRNSGCSPVVANYPGNYPWCFQTGKGIFSTPVVDGDETIYCGSADHNFYALNPDGTLKWQFATGEIIDSAAALARFDPDPTERSLVFASGDGGLYRLALENGGCRQVWKFEAEARPEVSFNRWFEGNVAVGEDGTLYAGNTNFNYYAITPAGELKWTYSTGSNNWSMAAFSPEGTIYWGSCDTFVRAVLPGGQELWRKRTLGFIAASAAVGADGTVYIGSFDSNFYALDPQTGHTKWKFTTGDHIYSSAALSADPQGNTTRIYFASTDGFLYALRPDGTLQWKYATLAPIRSSPAVGLAPEGGDIIYFGCGDGRLYAVNGQDGSLRWAFDTTPDDPELADRNDLNGSPALGKNGVYIGGEHGSLWYVPYDYPRHHPEDPRSQTETRALPESFSGLLYVTPGGNMRTEFPAELPAATQIALRLLVRQEGEMQDARLWNMPLFRPQGALEVQIEPYIPLQVESSADGRYVYIRPEGFLEPAREYTLTVKGKYYQGGLRFGNLSLRFVPKEAGEFNQAFHFRTLPLGGEQLPLEIQAESVTALEWTRLAAPLPTMLPSLNQIGFDYIDWIMAPVWMQPPDDGCRGRLVVWATGARRDRQGRLAVDPESDFTLAFNGQYQGDEFILAAENFEMAITGINIPFSRFELRGRLALDGKTLYPAAFAETQVLSIPNFGPYMVVAGLANNWYQKLLVLGTYVTRPCPPGCLANRKPPGTLVDRVSFQLPATKANGWVKATLRYAPGSGYPASEHRGGIVLVDEAAGEVVSLDYHRNLTTEADPEGNIKTIRLELPRTVQLSPAAAAYVLLDAFPAYRQPLDG